MTRRRRGVLSRYTGWAGDVGIDPQSLSFIFERITNNTQ